MTGDRSDAADRAVGREENDASASESLGQGRDSAPVVSITGRAESRWTQTGGKRAQLMERDERVRRKALHVLDAFVERPRAAQDLKRRKSEAFLLVLHGNPRDRAALGHLRQIDNGRRGVTGHRAVKARRARAASPRPDVSRIAVRVRNQAPRAHADDDIRAALRLRLHLRHPIPA